MRAAQSFGRPDEIRIVTLPDPTPGPGEVVCSVTACGVCATDVIDWYVAARLPAVLGHEPVGVVASVGAGVTSVSPGDRVVLHHHAPCGECRRCRRGEATMCDQFRATHLHPGGFAERVRVPAELVGDLLPVPADLDATVATLTEPLACVLRSQDSAGLREDDRLLIVGAGVNGLLQVAAARARGVTSIAVTEPRAERLRLAESFGAVSHTGQAVDVAIVCAPAADAIAAGAGALEPGGTLCLYAPPTPGAPLPIDGADLFLRGLTITTSYSATRAEMMRALAMLGEFDAASLISARVGLEEAGEALRRQRAGSGLKSVVVPGGVGGAGGNKVTSDDFRTVP